MLSRGKEAVRVWVQKYETNQQCEMRRFSVDPQITSLEELRNILSTAFDLKEEFSLSYRCIDVSGKEEFLALLSDWDLDAAFLRAHNMSSSPSDEPCINLRVDVRPKHMVGFGIQKNDTNAEKHTVKTPKSDGGNSDTKNMQTGFQGILINHVEKTLNLFSRALNLHEDPDAPPRPPLNQAEFHSFLGPVGHVVQGKKLREVIYKGGVDPSFRKVVWKHILNVYPDGMSGKERLDYMKRKSSEYYSLRDVWRDCLQKGKISNTLSYVTNMVRKDVLRTDRHHKFYAGSDDNQNITALFNILTTYALNHPNVSYCQGMSDIASPLLVVMNNEAHAYICLCALMNRLHPNFLLDGEAMTLKFAHLTESLQIYDPIFYAYLQSQQADDLLFCYRWLLLEMKREFAFEDALHMLEVLWSSLPSNPPKDELPLKDKEFSPDSNDEDVEEPPISPLIKTPRENAYTKLCAIRRQSSSYSLTSNTKGKVGYRRMNHSLDESIALGCSNLPLHRISKEFQSLDETSINFSEQLEKNGESVQINTLETVADSVNNTEVVSKLVINTKETKPINLPKNNEPLKATVNKFFPHLDAKDNNNIGNENVTKKLIKNFSEFKNITVKKNKIAPDSVGCETRESFGSNSSDDLFNTNEFQNKNPFQINSADISPNKMDENPSSTDQSPYSSSTSSPKHKTNGTLDETIEENNQSDFKATEDFNGIDFSELDKKYDDVFIWENPLHNKCFELKNNVDNLNMFNKICDENVNSSSSSSNNSKNTHENLVNKNTSVDIMKRKTDEMKFKSLSKDGLRSNSTFFSSMSQELENAKKNCEILLANKKVTNFQTIASTISSLQKKCDFQTQSSMSQSVDGDSTINACEEIGESNANKNLNALLPPSNAFGGGNPFLIFLCLTMLTQHRDVIMRSQMDYNELAMYFDKMVRKHNVHRVLNQARRMYSCYLKEHKSNVNM